VLDPTHTLWDEFNFFPLLLNLFTFLDIFSALTVDIGTAVTVKSINLD
jgi:hypothetical protein